MPTQYITIQEFCTGHHVELTFIQSLSDYGLVELSSIRQNTPIPENELDKLEKIARLYYELDINLEGIDAILHLLQQVETLQHQVTGLSNRLRRYEDL